MMKRTASAILALCLVLLPVEAGAEEPITGRWGENLTWSYDQTTKTLTISGEGRMNRYSSSLDPSDTRLYNYEDEIEKVVIEKGVTTVATDAFSSYPKLSDVSLPDGLRVIERYAFHQCSSLAQIEIPSTVYYIDSDAFSESGLTEITIPEGVLEIESYTFQDCTKLQKVNLSESVIQISYNAFSGCNELREINLPNQLREIGWEAFRNCTQLTELTIPDSVAKIEYRAFAGCSNLAAISLPSGLVDPQYGGGSIGDGMFSECESLTEITIPDGITDLGEKVFEGCVNLTTVNFPGSLEYVGINCFGNCPKLKTVNFNGGQGQWEMYKGNDSFDLTSGVSKDQTVTVNYLPGGKCGENSYWCFDGAANILYLDSDNFEKIHTPSDDSEAAWTEALQKVPFIFFRNVDEVENNMFSPGTVIHSDSYTSAEDQSLTIHRVNHPFGSPKSGNCKTAGYTRGYVCKESGCGRVPTSLAPKQLAIQPHEIVDYRIPATCISPGLDYGKRCRQCEKVLIAPEIVIPANGNHTEGEILCEEIIIPATDTTTGMKYVTYICSVCGVTFAKEKYIPAGTPPDGSYEPGAPDTPGILTISFDPNGGKLTGTGAKPTNANGDRKLTALPANPFREGFAFNGWYTSPTEGTKVTTALVFRRNTTVYARWVEKAGKVYTVTFNANHGGDGEIFDAMATNAEGKLESLPTATPARGGYTFGGWYTAKEGGNPVTTSTEFSADDTVYAHWTPNGGEPTDPDNPDPDQPTNPDNPSPDQPTNPDNPDPDQPTDPDNPDPDQPTNPDNPDPDQPTNPDNPDPDQPANPDNPGPDQPADPDKPTPPATTRYQIYTPARTPGGSFSVSHSSAAQGTQITVALSPRSDYALDRLLVTNLNTGRSIDLTRRYSDEYTFAMPASDVEVELSFVNTYSGGTYYYFEVPSRTKPGPTAWYYRDRHICHVTDGLVPDHTLITRDMLLSVLYNLTDDSLIPVDSLGSETNAAQVWATNNGIMPDIYASGLWGLDRALSQEQTAMLVYGYAGYRGCNTSQTASLTHYSDYGRVRPAARTAMSWVLAAGLLDSSSASSLSPQATVTCGQAGELFYRFVTTVAR